LRARRLGLALTLALLSALITSAAASAQSCVPRKNMEAIIDDSGSMGGTDSNKLRVQGLKLIMSTPGNENKLLGAVEFGSDANSVFDPGAIGANRTAFGQALDQRVQADNGGTNYNAGFELAKTHNPNADSRLFLTDGGHNEGDYANGHQGGPPTHAIGLGFIVGDDETRLKTIAAQTGGIYRKASDDSELQAAMNDVNARINCLPTPARYTDFFRRTGATKTRRLTIARGIRSAQFTLSWVNAADRFDIGRFRIYRGKRLVGMARARRLRTTKRRGSTFVTVKLSRLVRGRLRYRLRATRVSTNTFTGVKLITQASRSRRR
jgi:von Willebrand factor type A domain